MKTLTQSRGVVLTGALLLSHASAALAANGGESTPMHLTGVAPSTHVASSGGTSIVRTIAGLFIVIAVIYGVSWILRQARRNGTGRARGKALSPVASLPLGSGRSVQLVRAGREFLLLGVAEHGVTPIRSYSEAEALAAGLDLAADDPPGHDNEERPGGRLTDALRRITVRS